MRILRLIARLLFRFKVKKIGKLEKGATYIMVYCDSCGHKCVLRQRAYRTKAMPCPKCKKAMRRLISASTLIFKGGGWTPKHYK